MHNGAYLMAIVKQPKPSNYIINDSETLEDLYAVYKDKNHATRTWSHPDGYLAEEISGVVDNYGMKMFVTVRGNKVIVLMRVSAKDVEDKVLPQIVSTLKFLPYEQADWRFVTDSAKTVKVYCPSDLRKMEANTYRNKEIHFYAFDTFSATSYYVNVDTLDRFAWATNDSAFLYVKALEYMDKKDSIVEARMTKNGGVRGLDLLIQKGHSNSYQRLRLLAYGNLLYALSAGGERKVLYSKDAKRFFNEFEISYPEPVNFYKHKGKELIDALHSEDSTTWWEAYMAEDKHYWDTADLPMLYHAFLQQYKSPYPNGDSLMVNKDLAAVISRFPKSSNVRYMDSLYYHLNGGDERLKFCIMETMAGMETEESYRVLAKEIGHWPHAYTGLYGLRSKMTDSLVLLNKITPDLMRSLKDTGAGLLCGMLLDILEDTGLLNQYQLKELQPNLLSFVHATYERYNNAEVAEWGVYYIVSLLDKLNNDSTRAAMSLYLGAKSPYLRRKVALDLIDKGAEVPADVWNGLAADGKIRKLIYEDLKGREKLNLFPAAYLNQEAFAEGIAYGMGDDDELELDKVVPIGTEKLSVKGQRLKFYLYDVTYTDEPKHYLCVVGGYEPISKEITTDKDLSGMYWEEELDMANVKGQLQKYLNSKESEE